MSFAPSVLTGTAPDAHQQDTVEKTPCVPCAEEDEGLTAGRGGCRSQCRGDRDAGHRAARKRSDVPALRLETNVGS